MALFLPLAAADPQSPSWDDVDRAFAESSEVWQGVQVQHAENIALSREARANFEEASRNWGQAEEWYRRAGGIILAASAYDALRALDGAKPSCSALSTQQFRGMVGATPGVDVDHIVPRSLGGADHILNYNLVPASVNRSIGNAFGPWKCGWDHPASVGPARCAAAVSVSIWCGSYNPIR